MKENLNFNVHDIDKDEQRTMIDFSKSINSDSLPYYSNEDKQKAIDYLQTLDSSTLCYMINTIISEHYDIFFALEMNAVERKKHDDFLAFIGESDYYDLQ